VKSLPLAPKLKQLENEINDELKRLNLPAHVTIDGYDPERKTLKHTIKYFEVVAKDASLKIWEVIQKHFESYMGLVSLEF